MGLLGADLTCCSVPVAITKNRPFVSQGAWGVSRIPAPRRCGNSQAGMPAVPGPGGLRPPLVPQPSRLRVRAASCRQYRSVAWGVTGIPAPRRCWNSQARTPAVPRKDEHRRFRDWRFFLVTCADNCRHRIDWMQRHLKLPVLKLILQVRLDSNHRILSKGAGGSQQSSAPKNRL